MVCIRRCAGWSSRNRMESPRTEDSKCAVGFDVDKSEAAPPTALVDLAKPSYRLGIARIKVGWEGNRLGVKVKTDKKSYTQRATAEASIAVQTPDTKLAEGADVASLPVARQRVGWGTSVAGRVCLRGGRTSPT